MPQSDSDNILRALIREHMKKDKKPGAGFIIVRNFEGAWKVLGLRLGDKFDIPKGGVEKNEKNRFITAQRECTEECGILVSPLDLKWGGESIKLGHMTIFLAETFQDPQIQKNPKSGIYEHDEALWLDWDELEEKIYDYLKPAVCWARNKIEI